MNVVLIEDEPLALEKLSSYLQRYSADCQILAKLSSVQQVLDYFEITDAPIHLVFSDIELTDGSVFHALAQLNIPCPIVFTSSYDQYGLEAFRHQAVEYLLKPFTYQRFERAMQNIKQLQIKLQTIPESSTPEPSAYRQRFLLRNSQNMTLLKAADISHIRAAGGLLLATDNAGQCHILHETNLQQLEQQLDPAVFFRINRSDIININFVSAIEAYGKESLAAILDNNNEPLVSSQSRTAAFRKWLNK